MNKVSKFFKTTGEYIQANKKNIIINYIIFAGVITALLLIDLLTKQFLFQWENGKGKYETDPSQFYQNWLFGIRSVSNSGLTVLGGALPYWLIHSFNIIILLICLVAILFLRSKVYAVSIAFIFAGTMGNMIDRMAFGGLVRDIVYVPWLDTGTFNLADVDAVIGSLATVLFLLYQVFFEEGTRKYFRNKKRVKESNKLNQEIKTESQEKDEDETPKPLI